MNQEGRMPQTFAPKFEDVDRALMSMIWLAVGLGLLDLARHMLELTCQ